MKELIVGLSIKKILFPVQRVAKIEASRAAAKFIFFDTFFFSMKILSILGEKKQNFAKMKKKKIQPHLFEPPGRSTGNRIIFMDSLVHYTIGETGIGIN